MLLSSAMFSSGTLRSCSAWNALAAMVGRMDLRSSRSGFGFFMDGPAYYWMSGRRSQSRNDAGCGSSMVRVIALKNASSRAKIALSIGNDPGLGSTPAIDLAATDMALGSHSQAGAATFD